MGVFWGLHASTARTHGRKSGTVGGPLHAHVDSRLEGQNHEAVSVTECGVLGEGFWASLGPQAALWRRLAKPALVSSVDYRLSLSRSALFSQRHRGFSSMCVDLAAACHTGAPSLHPWCGRAPTTQARASEPNQPGRAQVQTPAIVHSNMPAQLRETGLTAPSLHAQLHICREQTHLGSGA